MKKYDLYLFDFDGTLVDSFDSLTDIFVLSFREVGVEIDPKMVKKYSRQPLFDTYKEVNAPMGKMDIFANAINKYLDDKEVLKKTKTYAETMDFMAFLKQNHIKCGIVTSNSERHVKDVLDLFNIDHDIFAIYVDHSKVEESKPSPKPILYALKEMGYLDKKEKVVYVGDGLNDALSAFNAGVDAVIVDRDNSFPNDVRYDLIYNLFDLFK